MGFIRVIIDRPIFLLMIELFLIVLGVMGYMRIGVEQFPKIEPPVITVTTNYPGAGPEEIETLVSKPIEEEINQIGGIERLISTSREGVSQIVVEFELRIDAKGAQTDVRDKVARVLPRLPDDTEEPLIQRLDFADRPILQLALSRKDPNVNVPDAELRLLADNLIKPQLQQIDGVGQVNLFGGREREIIVALEKQKLLLWKLTPSNVADAIAAANLNVPAGEVREEPVSRSLRLLGEYASVAEINDTVVKVLEGGRTISVGDLGTVRDSFKERDSFARVGDDSVVLIEIKKESDGNTVDVADAIAAQLAKISNKIPDGLGLTPVFDGARRIRMSVDDVIETMVIAAILAVLVVYLFLGSLQSTIITGISLPTVIITSFFALYVFDFTLNIMTLLGLTLSVGLLLDDAIVVRENIWKKIEKGMEPKLAAEKGTREVFIPVLATSLTVLATFIPVAFIPGIVGKFFAAFALTVVMCVVLSTFDALTVAPCLSARMVARGDEQERAQRGFWGFINRAGRRFNGVYDILLTKSLRRPGFVLVGAAAVFVGAIMLVPSIGFTFLPEDDSGEIEVTFEAPPGTTITKSNEIAAFMEQLVANLPETKYYSTRVGNDLGDKNVGSIYLRLYAEEERDRSTAQVRSAIRKALQPIGRSEDLNLTVGQPGGGGGPGKPIQAVVEGPDIDRLFEISQRFLSEAAIEVPEAVNLESNLKPGRSEIQFKVDRQRVAAFALDTNTVGQTIRGLFEGHVAGQFREDGEEYDIRVQLPPEERTGVAALQDFTIPNERGEAIPLFAVTQVQRGQAPTKVVRIDQQRAVRIQGDLAEGTALAGTLQKLTTMTNKWLPEGYRLEFQGQAESLRDLAIGAVTALFLGALFIYMIMASLYESLVIPFAILLTLPLAIIGAVLALLVAGRFLDVYAVIGVILLMGLVTKNAILLVDYAETLRKDEGVDRLEALRLAGLRRMRPIMMTTVAMVAGMAPVALGMGELNKVRAGMGIAAIGGLISSTALSLLVVPCFYIYLDNLRNFSRRMAGVIRRQLVTE